MIELILGGARSGKSALAEQLAVSSDLTLFYVATATAEDAEMQQRILHHRGQRGDDWQLIEEPVELARVLRENQSERHCILVDCLTLWITNLLMLDDDARLHREKQLLLDILTEFSGHLVMVSNEVGLGIVPLGHLNRRFVDEVGFLHQAIAQQADRVIFTVAGIPQVIKGPALY